MATLLLRRTRPTSFKPFLTLQSSQPFQAFHTVKLHTRPLAHLTGLTLGFTTLTYTTTPSAILRCDGAPMTSSSSPSSSITSTAADSIRSYQSDAKTPVVKSGQGRLNPKAVKQISAGSICGVVGGLAVSAFSKPLAVLVGLLVFGVQVRLIVPFHFHSCM